MRKILISLFILIFLFCPLRLIYYPIPSYAAGGYVYTITPGTSSLDLGTFSAAIGYTSSPDMNISVSTDDPNVKTVTITVSDSKTASKGYLTLGGADNSTEELTNALTVKGGDVSSYAPLTSDQTLESEVAISNSSVVNITDFSVQQTIATGDLFKTAGSYQLTMTFTATFAP